MTDDKIERKIAVIFATDVVGYSKHMEQDEDETLKSFRACKKILEKLFEEHGGTIFNTCLLYTSPSPRDRQKSRMPSSA